MSHHSAGAMALYGKEFTTRKIVFITFFEGDPLKEANSGFSDVSTRIESYLKGGRFLWIASKQAVLKFILK